MYSRYENEVLGIEYQQMRKTCHLPFEVLKFKNPLFQDFVFIDDTDEDIDDHQKIEELHKRRNFLASYCKLIVYNVIPTKVYHPHPPKKNYLKAKYK